MNRDLLRVITFGSALTWGGVMASLEALRLSNTGFSFAVSWLTAVFFLTGVGMVYLFWQFMLKEKAGARQRKLRLAAEITLIASGVAAFLYPLRFVPSDKLHEIFIGLIAATIALSIVGYMLFSIHRFLEADSRPK